MRIRLFQKRCEGPFFRAVWVPGVGRNQAPLQTHDKAEAEQCGRLLLAELLKGGSVQVDGPLALGDLWQRFKGEAASYLDNKPKSRADTASRVKHLLGFFGPERDVRSLNALDQLNYSTARRRGGIRLEDGRVTSPVRASTVAADVFVLHHMLAWACTVPTSRLGRLLDRQPLAGVRREREKNPRRPVATWERFEATRAAMQRNRTLAGDRGVEVQRWTRMELALVLAEATGRRLGSIRALRWDDIDWERGTIRWRAEADKKGLEWVVPSPAALLEELRVFHRALGATDGSLFPAEKNPAVTMDRHLFDKWLTVAEQDANLPKLTGSLWHSYRRKWASERRHHPLPDVAAAGGWRDQSTLLECYQAPDETAILAVMSEPAKRHEQRAAC